MELKNLKLDNLRWYHYLIFSIYGSMGIAFILALMADISRLFFNNPFMPDSWKALVTLYGIIGVIIVFTGWLLTGKLRLPYPKIKEDEE